MVEGWLNNNEAELLFNLAKNVKNGVIVEIGSYKGKSALALGRGAKVKVYTVDCDKSNLKELNDNIKKAKLKNIISISKYSKEAAESFNDKIGMLFIDGNHSYESISEDFLSWKDKVISGGIIAFHDVHYSWNDVTKFVREIIFRRDLADFEIFETIVYCRRKDKLNLADRLMNRFFYFKFLMHTTYSLRFIDRLVGNIGKLIK
ncbi:MAG: class I SAM-dependent methyltransferase [archaeon]